MSLIPQSPGLNAAPIFNSGSNVTTVWGRGWSSDLDQTITPSANRLVTWTDGSGAQLNFFNTMTSTPSATPAYTSPVNSYVTMRALTAVNGIPSVVEERDLDGTTRLFTVFDSTSVLRLNKLTDRNGNMVTNTRDGQGRLTQAMDVHGRFFQMTYDAAGFVHTLTDSYGRTTTFTYDAQGRRTDENGPVGHLSYTFDPQNRLTQIGYPNGGVKNYTYDTQNRILTEDEGSGNNLLTYSYSQASTSVTDALNRTTIYQFVQKQGMKKVSSITNPANNVTSFTYDANFNLLSAADPLGHVTRYSYDSNGNVTAIQDAAAGTTLAIYDPIFNQPTSVTNPLGRTLSLSYDAKGNLTQVRDPLSKKTNLSYDGTIGHVVKFVDPLGHTAAFSYSASNGALATVTDSLNQTSMMQTDALSRVTQFTDPLNNITQFNYDQTNLTQITDALGNHTDFSYDPGRNNKVIKTVTNANSRSITWNHDVLGRINGVVDQLGHSSLITYDAAGRPQNITTRGGQTFGFVYDNLDRPTQLSTPDGNVNLGYDAVGNLLTANKYNGSSLGLNYDALNRVTQVVQTLPNNFPVTIRYTYDASGNRASMTTPWGSTTYAYDTLNHLTSITNPRGEIVTFTYDATGRRTKMTYPNGITTTYVYDAAGKATQILAQRASDQNTIAFNNYAYDANGNRTGYTDAEGAHALTYDHLNRLTSATHPATSSLPNKNESFSYDAVGNRMADAQRTGYQYDAANRPVTDSSYTYTSDLNGNVTSKTDRGTGITTAYAYDSSNHLIEVDQASSIIATYKYDAAGRRVEKNVGGAITRYVYDGANILAILDGSNTVLQVFTNGLGIDQPLIMSQNNQDYFYHANVLGSVTALTDSSGKTAETIEYEAYGQAAVKDTNGNLHTTSTLGNTFLFTGREFDSETGLYFYRARTLDAESGRFLQEDLLPRINQYAYALDSPEQYVDPQGASNLLAIATFAEIALSSGMSGGLGPAVVIGTLGAIFVLAAPAELSAFAIAGIAFTGGLALSALSQYLNGQQINLGTTLAGGGTALVGAALPATFAFFGAGAAWVDAAAVGGLIPEFYVEGFLNKYHALPTPLKRPDANDTPPPAPTYVPIQHCDEQSFSVNRRYTSAGQ
jgi:RHS repeat-associated protein